LLADELKGELSWLYKENPPRLASAGFNYKY